MDGGGVDHDAQDTRAEGQAGHRDELVVGRVRADAQVGARGGRRVAEMGEEALGHRDRLGRRFEDHRREVEKDSVEDDGQVGVRTGVQPQRRGAAAEVREGVVVQPLGVVAAQLDTDVAAAGRRGTGTGADAVARGECSVGGVPSGLTGMPSRVVRVSLAHTASSGSSSRSRPAFRRTAAAAFSQSARVEDGASRASARVPWAGSSSTGSRRPPSTASFDVMGRTLGAAPCPSQPL